jgi:hypothetical protein
MLREPGINQVMSIRRVHPLADELGNFLFTLLIFPGTASFFLLPLRGLPLLFGLACSPFRPLVAVRKIFGLAKSLKSRMKMKRMETRVYQGRARNKRQDGQLPD